MAAPPVLLVADDLSVIASVKRVLAREGYECVLATNAADALIAWGHSVPGLILLQPSVEGGRGAVVLEELAAHPEARLVRVVLLGESVPGFPWPVEPLPIDPQGFAQTVADNFRAADRVDDWKVLETMPAQPAERAKPHPFESDAWRATQPSQAFSPLDTEANEPVPRLVTVTEALTNEDERTPSQPPASPAPVGADDDAPAEPPTPPEGVTASPAPKPSPAGEVPEEPTASLRVPTQPASSSLASRTAQRPESRADRGAADRPEEDEGAASNGPPRDISEEPATPAPSNARVAALPTGPEATRSMGLPTPSVEEALEPAAAPHAGFSLGLHGPDGASVAPEASGAASALAEAHAGAAAERSLPAESDTLGGTPATPMSARPAGAPTTDAQYPAVTPLPPTQPGLADRLFGDLPELDEALHQDVEAQVMATVASALAAPALDEELARLEDEVRAEAQRRRVARVQKARGAVRPLPIEGPEASPPRPAPEDTASLGDERGVSGLTEDTTPTSPPARSSPAVELLSRAEQIMLEGRAAAEAKRGEAEAERTKRAAEHEAVLRRAEQLEALLQKERDARAELEEARSRLSEEVDRLTAELELVKSEVSKTLEARRAELEAALAAAVAERDEARHEVSVLVARLEREAGEAKAAREDAARALDALRAELEGARAAAEAAAQANAHSLAEALEQRDEAREALEALTKRAAALEADLGAATDKLDETARERDELKSAYGAAQGDLERTTEELERALDEIAGLTRALEEARAQVAAQAQAMEELRARAESAEARAAVTQEKVDALERRALAPLALPGGRMVSLPRTGTVSLEGLARLVGQLVLAQADGRLELGVPGGVRTLWFKRGAVLAAESTLEHESLIDRARRDGLIDARQESELRMLKTATPREQLDALKARGAIRDAEVVPLVQRYTEQSALEAFAEPSTNYRLVDEPPSDAVLVAAVPRATLPMLAESLRRAVPQDALLEQLGGGEAVPRPTNLELDLRALGFSERERNMLTWADGEATVEDLSLASGLKPDVAFRALLVAKLLGVIEMSAPKKSTPMVDAELDVRRLEAKYDEVQDADYFTILGLPRTAGAEDVQRAFERLGSEFDPLRFSSHPDPSLQQRAQVVYRLLEEAARALEDDRRRAEYARHLLD
jgi:hypothetical protein